MKGWFDSGITGRLEYSREYRWGAVYLPNKVMSKYRTDKERMDIIAERLVHRQDIWQDRYIYWIAVALGHILEWVVKHEHSNVVDGSDNGITDSGKGE